MLVTKALNPNAREFVPHKQNYNYLIGSFETPLRGNTTKHNEHLDETPCFLNGSIETPQVSCESDDNTLRLLGYSNEMMNSSDNYIVTNGQFRKWRLSL